MLVLTRHTGQEIVIGGDIRVLVLEVRGESVRIGIDAPAHVAIHRLEVFLRKQKKLEEDREAGSESHASSND